MQASDTFTKTPLEVGRGGANCKETWNDTWMGEISKQDLQQGPESEIPHNFSPLVFQI